MRTFLSNLVLLTALFCCRDTWGQVPPEISDDIPTVWLDESLPSPATIAADTAMDWSAIWRSSDQPGESRSTLYKPDDWEVRPRGKRTGCLCMDGEEEKNKGRGACAGRGGVRYWIHESPEGKEIHHPTARHLRHPDPMSKEEKLGLAAYNEEDDEGKKPPGGGWGGIMGGFVNLAIVLGASSMVIYYMRNILAPKSKRKGRKTKRKSSRRQESPANAASEELSLEHKPDKTALDAQARTVKTL